MKWEDEALLQLFGCVGCGEVEVEDDEDYSQRCIFRVDEVFSADIVRATCHIRHLVCIECVIFWYPIHTCYVWDQAVQQDFFMR